MSLIKQLWMAIALIMLIGFGGSFLVSSLSAKAYLQEQLLLKNLDNATSMAAMLSQLPKDEIIVEQLVAAQFDIGHYESIRLVDPDGNVLVERISEDADLGAPAWFAALLQIKAEPGVGQVQDGWQQYGTLTMASHARFAYRELWRGTLNLLYWFLGAALLAGLAGTLLLRVILRPLDGVVLQAEAIGARRFITTPEPGTLEFQAVVRSMNSLAKRVRQMLEEESLRLDQLRREAHYDSVSAVLNRGHFVARVQSVLEREDEAAQGVLVIARLLDLNDLNRSQGWAVMDTLIKRFAQALRALEPDNAEWVFGRLNGSDFGVLAPAVEDPSLLAHQINDALNMLARELNLEMVCRLPTAATRYRHGDKLGPVLARVDAALAAAVDEGGSSIQIAGPAQKPLPGLPQGDLASWRQKLDAALTAGHLKLHSFPVVDAKGDFIHGECVARMRLVAGGEWLSAGEFMPWLARLGYSSRLDEIVIDLALERLRHGADDLCINLSAQAMNDAVLVHRIASKLADEPQLSARLWLEVPEHGVFQNLEHFRILCAMLKPVGCRLGIEHVGHQVSRIGQLHDLGIDYIKIDASFVRNLEQNQANQVFLRGLAIIAHSIGLSAIGEGVASESDFRMLMDLGMDGATGPAVTLREQDSPIES
jgi:EAL domain-containing protein (putative c-di-GMP-specific phosphodiesterase class I)/GGDEF domain-containing protein